MTDRRRGRRDALSAHSNRSLAGFWASVLGVICCGFVIIGLLGPPAHNAGKPALRNIEAARTQAHESIAPLANERPSQAKDARVAQPATFAVRITLPPDASIPGASASGRDQGNQALAIAQLTELDAEIARRTSDLEMLTMKRDQLQSQIKELSSKLEQASRQLAGAPSQVSKTGKPMVASRVTAIAAHQVLRPTPYREPSSAQLQANAREGMILVKQLLAARTALVDNDSFGARGLLEAAQTSIVFTPRNTAHESASVAVAQITEALTMLNSGDRVHALRCLDRAIGVMQLTF